jgi:hypothetical protein
VLDGVDSSGADPSVEGSSAQEGSEHQA